MKYCLTYKTEQYDYEVFVQAFKDTYVRSIGPSPVGENWSIPLLSLIIHK